MVFHDDIIFGLQNWGGISVYWTEILRGTRGSDLASGMVRAIANSTNPDVVGGHTLFEPRWPLAILRYLPLQARLGPGSIFHSSYYRVSAEKGVRNVTTVHDFTYEKFRSGMARVVHSTQKARAIRRADRVICISESTKRDLLEFYPNTPVEKLRVIHEGASPVFQPLAVHDVSRLLPELSTDRQVVLFVGGRGGYKNFASAVSAMDRLPEAFHLVLVGGGALTEAELEQLSTIRGRWSKLDFLSETDLNLLYNRAHCLLYPSLYEGFGIPPLEAMQAGCPVVAVATSSVPEVVGDAGILVTEGGPEELAAAIVTLQEPTKRSQILALGKERSRMFSWERCVRETLDVYRELMGRLS